MTGSSEHRSAETASWEHLGRAAEQLARGIASEARHFAGRVERHLGSFAHEVRREWHCGGRRYGRHEGPGVSREDVRTIFEDVRSLLATVLDGVDEFLGSLLQREPERTWVRVVLNREATCGRCGRSLAAGDEVHVRGAAAAREFRCRECGIEETKA